jgi:hypothetical protein
MLTSGFPCLKLGLHAKLHLHACLVYFLHPLLLQTIYVLLPLVDDLAEVNKLPLALLKDRVYVIFRLIAHFLDFIVQDIVIPSKPSPIFSLNLRYEIICPIRFLQLIPDLIRVGFNLGKRIEDLRQTQIDNPIGVWGQFVIIINLAYQDLLVSKVCPGSLLVDVLNEGNLLIDKLQDRRVQAG